MQPPDNAALQGLRVLIVDDTEGVRGTLRMFLEDVKVEVLEATDGKKALDLICREKIDLVISDIRMPNLNGVDLVSLLRKQTKYIPILLMSGFSDVMGSQKAVALGADGFLSKPFLSEDLLRAVHRCLDQSARRGDSNRDHEFSEIAIDDFASGSKLIVDIFIRSSEEKYLKIAGAETNYQPEKIKRLKDKGIKEIYILKSEFQKYVDFTLKIKKGLDQTTAPIDPEKKRNFLLHLSEVIVQHLHLKGVDEQSFDQVKTTLETNITQLLEDKSCAEMLFNLDRHSDFMYAHHLGVSLYAMLIGKKANLGNADTLRILSLSGLFHDFGLLHLDKTMIVKPREIMTSEERDLLEQHPIKVLEMLKKVSAISNEVREIILHHHENQLGTGYPSGIPGSRIHPLGLILSVANEFCELVIEIPGRQKYLPMEAIEHLKAPERGLDLDYIGALSRCFKSHSVNNKKAA